MDKNIKLPIINLHTCIQGEGRSTGQPMILIRFTKCNLNCMFKGSICDASETSWNHDPNTGSVYTLQDIEDMILDNPLIQKVMITGGQPTFQPDEFMAVARLVKGFGLSVEIEDNGTTFLPIFPEVVDLVSMSPKLRNSIPVPGMYVSEINREVTIEDKDKHEKSRTKYKSMKKWIESVDYQLKFVISDESDIIEALEVCEMLEADPAKVYFMPEGSTRKQLDDRRKWLYEKCIYLAVNYSDRLHIVVYDDLKGV